MLERLFAGVYPCGIVYADTQREEAGDFMRLGFLSFSSLELEVVPNCPAMLEAEIRRHAATIQAQAGSTFQVSTAGQTVRLGQPERKRQ